MSRILWALVANSSFAKIYEITGYGKEIREIIYFDNPEGRKKPGEIISDRPGRNAGPVGKHALGRKIEPHQYEQKLFVRRLAEVVDRAKGQNQFNDLAVIAPPHFLGELMQALSPEVKASIIKEINKDLPSTIAEKERIDHLCNYLELWNR